MREKDRKQAQRLIDQMNVVLQRLIDSVSDLAFQLERLMNRSRQEERDFARMRDLHRLDPLRGDYKHRPNGKRPLDPRFRFYDETTPLTRDEFRHLVARTHREKSDQRRGRMN